MNNLLLRRRALMGMGGKDESIVLPDHIRLIVKGQGDTEVQFINGLAYSTGLIAACDSMYIDGELLSTATDRKVFNDTNWHDIYFRTAGDYFNTLTRMSFSWYPARVIDIPEMYLLPSTANQTFKVAGVGNNVPYTTFNFIFRHKSLLEIPQDSGDIVLWGWNKTSVNLYVPSNLMNDYSNYVGGKNNNLKYSNATILALEQSQFNKRLPIEQLNLD
jgi:hypothetical protein